MSEACAHSAYWRGVYDTCMACRAEQAEAEAAALHAETERLRAEAARQIRAARAMEGAMLAAIDKHEQAEARTITEELVIARQSLLRAEAEIERLREELELRDGELGSLDAHVIQLRARTRALEAEIDLLHRELDRANAEAVQAGHMIVRKNAALARPCIACGYEPKMIRPAALTEPTPPAGPA